MTASKKTILVPWDFTEKSEFALKHAINFARKTGDKITLLHIVDKGGLLKNKSKKVQETIDATNRMNVVSSEFMKETGIEISPIVLEGSIFTTIADVAKHFQISIVVMGTHGMKGIQKVTGSWALKVISSAHLPFLIVQSPPANDTFNNIVFPVDISKESSEKLSWAKYMCSNFKSNIRIVKQHYEGTKASSNLAIVSKYLSKNEIPYDVYEAVKKKDFAESVVKYAKRIKSDAILIMIKKDINIADYIMGLDEQTIIFNEYKLPVICINPGNKA